MGTNKMNYRDMLGFSKKKVKKVVTPKPTAPPVTELLKKEFGSLNEWGNVDTGPKRWTGSGLTEFEQRGGKDSINEKENWQAVDNVFINFLKANTKILAKFGKSRDRKKIAKGVEGIISGLTNGLDAFKKDKF